MRALAPKIKAPTLVVHCRDDAMVPFSQGRLLATLIPGAQSLALEGRNHILQDGESSWRRLWDEAGSFLSVDDCADRRLRDAFSLTRRGQELLDLLAQGRSNADIGAALGIAPKTVRNHISNIFDKLSVSHRAEAVVRAREAGFGNGSGHLAREIGL